MTLLRRSHRITLAVVGVSVMIVAGSLALSAPSRAFGERGGALAAPTLSQLPGALAAGHLPLSIALPARVTGTTLRAAVVATSAVERVAGASGVPTRVLVGPSADRIASLAGPVISIAPRRGASELSLASLPSGHIRLTIAGEGEGLLAAARLLSTPAITAFTTRSAAVPAGLAKPVTAAPVPASAPITAVSATARGTVRVRSEFTVPIARQLVGDNRLELVTAYSSRAGGRISASLGGGLLGGFDAPANGQLRTVSKFTLTPDPALSGATIPGSLVHPGRNQLVVTASPARAGTTGTLQVLPGSQLQLKTRPRPSALELGLWPFPIYDASAWSDATVVLGADPPPTEIAAVISALANSARITGVPADPKVALGTPTRADASGNLVLVGSAAAQAAEGRLDGLGRLHTSQPRLPGVLEEVRRRSGRIALLAYGAPALAALGPAYQPGSLHGRAVLVDSLGRAHILAQGEAIPLFAQPRWPWLAPAALLAVLALGWIALRTWQARGRLVALAPLDASQGGGS